jgi:hypothetical protein
VKSLNFENLYKQSIELDKHFTKNTQLSSTVKITMQTILNSEVHIDGSLDSVLSNPPVVREIRCHSDEINKSDLNYFSGGVVPTGTYKMAINPADKVWFELKQPPAGLDRETKIYFEIKQKINNKFQPVNGTFQLKDAPYPNTNGSAFYIILTRQGD